MDCSTNSHTHTAQPQPHPPEQFQPHQAQPHQTVRNHIFLTQEAAGIQKALSLVNVCILYHQLVVIVHQQALLNQ